MFIDYLFIEVTNKEKYNLFVLHIKALWYTKTEKRYNIFPANSSEVYFVRTTNRT